MGSQKARTALPPTGVEVGASGLVPPRSHRSLACLGTCQPQPQVASPYSPAAQSRRTSSMSCWMLLFWFERPFLMFSSRHLFSSKMVSL